MAGFLILEGATGSLLAFRSQLEHFLTPELFAVSRPGVAPMPLGQLAERAQLAAPHAFIWHFAVAGDQAVFHVGPRADPLTGEPYALGFDHLYLDPWTGAELGRRQYGNLAQGRVNVIPFLYELHQNLALGPFGTLLLGLVALLWTLDCFIGGYLTLPMTLRRFLARWKPAWQVKWPASAVRVNFDLHRASGLWLWPLLFVFAWSSVMFDLWQVYEPVTGVLFDYRSTTRDYEAMVAARPRKPEPKLGWRAAQVAGEALMRDAAARYGFSIERPYGMAYLAEIGVYTYGVASDVNVQASAWTTSLWLDGDTGALVEVDLPRGEHLGNTIENWLRALHFADLRDFLAYRILVCALGLAIVLLSATGIYIWWKKRRAQRHLGSVIQAVSGAT